MKKKLVLLMFVLNMILAMHSVPIHADPHDPYPPTFTLFTHGIGGY